MPAELAVGAGTAVFVAGTCFAPGERLESLVLLVDGEEQPLGAFGMPRLETLHANEPDGYRSGFWGMAGIRSRARRAGPARPARRAAAVEEAPLATIPRRASRSSPSPRTPRVADLHDHLRPADGAVPAPGRLDPRADPRRLGVRDQRRLLGARALRRDPGGARRRPALPCSRARRGGSASTATSSARSRWRPPTRPTSRSPTRTTRWHPDKLATLLAELGDAQLVYSDARVVDGDGRVLADTYWSRRTNNHRDLLSLLVANSVTGAASLFPRSLLDDALPFPPAQFAHFHDHWLALVALSLGDIAFVERPLYDYVQHGGATLGHAAANRMPGMRERLEARAPRPARADPAVADALLRRRLPAAAVHDDPAAAVLAADGGGQAPRARALRARRPLAARARRAGVARRAGAAGPPPRHARRRVDARPRLRLAAPARRQHARRAEPRRAARLAAAAGLRPAAGRPRARRAGRARGRREDHAAAAGGERRRAAAGQPADPVDRPPALLRGLHRQVQPRAAARRARRAGADRHRRPGRRAARELAPRRRGLQRAGGDARRGRGRVRARVAGDRDEPRGRADRDHVVDRPPRERGAALSSTPSASST